MWKFEDVEMTVMTCKVLKLGKFVMMLKYRDLKILG